MKHTDVVHALPLFPNSPGAAIGANQFLDRWYRSGGPERSSRQLYRYLGDLERCSLVATIETDNGIRYYRDTRWWLG